MDQVSISASQFSALTSPKIGMLASGEGITLWALGVLVTLKALGNETGGSYALFEEVVFPGQEGLPGHVHTLEDETWYMLEGELVWTLGGQDFLGKKGSFIHLPRFVPHSCANKSNKPARMVITYAPAGFEQWYLDVGKPAVADHRNSPPDVSSEELSRAMRRGKEYGIIFTGHEDEDSEMMASGSNQTPYQLVVAHCSGGGEEDSNEVVKGIAGTMAGGHHGNGITYGGLTLHTTKGWHSRVGKGMCAIMWFWILYRAKQDGAVLLGWRHPWDHAHGHGQTGDHSKAEHH